MSDKEVIRAKKLIQEDIVVAIIGACTSALAKAVSPLVKEKGSIVYVLAGSYMPEHKYIFASSVIA